jgi:hypothetical protein
MLIPVTFFSYLVQPQTKNKSNVLIAFFAGIGGALLTLLLAFYIGYHLINFSFLTQTSCGEDGKFIYCFFDKDWNSEGYLSVITSFYTTIITILIALLGAFAAFSFITIRSSALQKAEAEIEKEVNKYFSTSRAEKRISQELRKIDDRKIKELKGQISEIRGVLEENGIEVGGTLGTGNEKTTK